MLFNSAVFVAFFAVFFPLYWIVHRHSFLRKLLLVAGSYLFYGAWDWRFLSLIILSTLVDFAVGLALYQAGDESTRKKLLAVSLAVNLGALGIFKYFNFFISGFVDLLAVLSIEANYFTTSIILPVGISFYTFQTLSYTIDIYRRELEPTQDLLGFAAFVAFFPQLVAGPIERAARLLPQMLATPYFSWERARDGGLLVLWGLFKKVLIADRIGVYVDAVFADPSAFGPWPHAIAVLFFAFQIYFDFSGYSNIARGLAKLLGLELMVNFRAPYFATSLRDFWRRWHISLSTWFRDYVYIPLGGSRQSSALTKRNIFLTFVVSGIWHGANYTFVAWGAWHGLGQILDPFSKLDHRGGRGSGMWKLLGWLATMLFVYLGWVLFRAESIGDAAIILHSLAELPFTVPVGEELLISISRTEFVISIYLLLFAVCVEWLADQDDILRITEKAPQPVRWGLSWIVLAHLLLLAPADTGSFIYFQF